MTASLPSLDHLMRRHQLWRAAPVSSASDAFSVVGGMAGVPTGLPCLDGVLPTGGWPQAAITELLLPAEGLGEIQLLWPTLARLTQSGRRVVLVAPPFIPFPQAWQQAGVCLPWLEIIEASGREALWAMEQCLRSGACAAVVGWPRQADHTVLRRFQVAADRGRCLGFMMRHARHVVQPSPAALRLQLLPGFRLQVLKCRGGTALAEALSWRADDGTLFDTHLKAPMKTAMRAATKSVLKAARDETGQSGAERLAVHPVHPVRPVQAGG
ncbi:MAG: translesion DNA synthesis-associated protein ImuA [Lautropia sp.]|nr:translesion DNA synthesis-associated protein ImuA [Lautropia sp.]